MGSNKTYKRKRNPVILLVCEGKNKTERQYFYHFNTRESHFQLKIKDSEATDVMGMARKAATLYKNNEMDVKNGDQAFCLIDLDLNHDKYEKYIEASKKYPKIKFIASNPCFEIWLLYHFTETPKVELSSKAVKEQLKKYIPEYNEAMDVYLKCNLEHKYEMAICRSQKRNSLYETDISLENRNPYTEIQDLVIALKQTN